MADVRTDALSLDRRYGALRDATALLGDHAALEAAYQADGYLFLRDVLDRDDVARLHDEVVGVLAANGIARVEGGEALWTGGSTAGFDRNLLYHGGLWEAFVDRPGPAAVFEQVLGEPPFFLQVAAFSYTRPHEPEPPYPHQDGFYIPGIPFRTFWLPLAPVEPQMGGLAIAAGSHKRGWLAEVDVPKADDAGAASAMPSRRAFSFPASAVPDDAWCRSTYEPGDLLVFHPQTLHSGLPNEDDRRLRLSMNVRAQPASAPRPPVLRLDALGVMNNALDGMRVLSEEGVADEHLHEAYCRFFARDLDFGDRPLVRRALAAVSRD
jgi:hypothetical protein